MSDTNAGDGDKRSVATDALETLGTLIGPNEKRDAIHLAVDPVTAAADLQPGQHISVKDGKAYPADVGKGLGIVDPFLPAYVPEGARFWFVMYPRQVHSLRHVWTHPAMPEATDPRHAASTAWLKDFAGGAGITYDELMDGARGYIDNGIEISSAEYGKETPDEFWDHYQIVTGTIVAHDKRYSSIFECCA